MTRFERWLDNEYRQQIMLADRNTSHIDFERALKCSFTNYSAGHEVLFLLTSTPASRTVWWFMTGQQP